MVPALFVVVPIVELVVLAVVSDHIGWPVALTVVVITGLLGAWLVQRQGAAAWRAIGDAFQQGRLPAGELADGALVVVGGAFLLTPGFLTDVVGFSLMIPRVRAWIRRTVSARVQRRVIR